MPAPSAIAAVAATAAIIVGIDQLTKAVIVGAIGPGAERFKGYMDNTDFGRILQSMLERP